MAVSDPQAGRVMRGRGEQATLTMTTGRAGCKRDPLHIKAAHEKSLVRKNEAAAKVW
jgi:hypothetical protein